MKNIEIQISEHTHVRKNNFQKSHFKYQILCKKVI